METSPIPAPGPERRVENALPLLLLFALWIFALVRRGQRRTAGK